MLEEYFINVLNHKKLWSNILEKTNKSLQKQKIKSQLIIMEEPNKF